MARKQILRSTAAAMNGTVLLDGERAYCTTDKTLRMGDGVEAGGRRIPTTDDLGAASAPAFYQGRVDTYGDLSKNVAYGRRALEDNTYVPDLFPAGGGVFYAGGDYNSAFGDNALRNNTTGRRNTAVGADACFTLTEGYYNTVVGAVAGYSLTTGFENCLFGVQVCQYGTTASNNSAMGTGALNQVTTGNDNSVLGWNAAKFVTTGNRNVAIGSQAALNLTTGSDNIIIGFQAGSAQTTASFNIAIGSAALGANVTGTNIVAIGRRALLAATGSRHTVVGEDAGVSATSGNNLTLFGYSAGASLTTASDCAIFGRQAAGVATTATGTTAVGDTALAALTTGVNNTALGRNAGSSITTETNCAALGYNAQVTGSNQVQIGDSSTTTYVYGTVQNRSDERDKADARPTQLGREFIRRLNAVQARWDLREDYFEEVERLRPVEVDSAIIGEDGRPLKKIVQEVYVERVPTPRDGSKKRNRFHSFLIAQQVQAVCDEMGVDFGGLQNHAVNGGKDVWTLGYDEFIPELIAAYNETDAEVQQLRAQVAELRAAAGL